MTAIQMRFRWVLIRCCVPLMTLALFAAPAAAHDSFPWPTVECTGGQVIGCWNPVPNAGDPVSDAEASTDDSNHSSSTPLNGDLYGGINGGLPTVYYAYVDQGTSDPDDDHLFFRMRLNETPVLAVNGGSKPPLNSPNGPYSSNVAWNFILDVNGDGWADFAASTDGNTGTNQDPFDTYRLAYINTPGDQLVTNDSACVEGGGGGQLLYLHKVNDSNGTNEAGEILDTCDFQHDPNCDFGFTRVTNNPPSTTKDFFLDMQFPLAAFDDCSGLGTDDDTEVGTTLTNTQNVPGEQLITPVTPFSICVTTSTQPNDFTNKDIAYEGVFRTEDDLPLPCGDPCTLAFGCQENPVFVEIEGACNSGSQNPTMTATVLDAMQSPDGTTVATTVDSVFFEYQPDGGSTWTAVVPVTGTNPVTAPTSGLNEWSITWNTSGLTLGGYKVRATATDQDGNSTVSQNLYSVTLGGSDCSISTSPVTLAFFEATPDAQGVTFEWSTITETANLGFNLYVHSQGGWERINDELISSQAVDSTEPLHYSYVARGLAAERFKIEDVATDGATRQHGPFRIGEAMGERPQPEVIDWDAVRRENQRPIAVVRGRSSRSAAAVELRVEEEGIYRLSYEQLRDAGFDLAGVPLAHLALTEAGEPRPLWVEGKGSFGPGDYVEFYGRGLDTLYTGTNVYRLAADTKSARRMGIDRTRPSGAAATSVYYEVARVERDLAYSFAAPNGDPWYDTWMMGGTTPRSWSFDLSADGYLDGVAPAHLSVELWGVTDWPIEPDHHVRIEVNGVEVADALLDGLEPRTLEAELPPGTLHAGANTLTIELPGDTGAAYELVSLDAYTLTYPRALTAQDGGLIFGAAGETIRIDGVSSTDVSVYRFDGAEATRLERLTVEPAGGGTYRVTFAGTAQSATYAVASGGAFLAPALAPVAAGADLTTGAAEYLVISHAAFLDGLDPLVRTRESEGLSVRVVDVDDVYAAFSGGVFDAAAIREFITYAHANLGTRFVLLVGGDTYDYRNRLGNGSISFVPTLYAPTGPVVAYTPSDALLADVDGDEIQDVAIGRLPVRTAGELGAVIAKILAFESLPEGRTAVFAADATDAGAGISFSADSEDFLQWFPEWEVERAYIDSWGVTGARQRLIDGINQGATLTSFMGHSAATMWSFSRLFTTADAARLTNEGSPTVVLQAGCWNNYFVEPRHNTLGHALLVGGEQGAAAVIGSAALTDVLSHHELARHLGYVLGNQQGISLGEALTLAKQRLAVGRPELRDVLLGVNLLGDPATVLER